MIHHGDLFDVLPTLDEASIDACVTDPPYGIGFMGKEWDSFSPAQAAKKQGLRQLDKSPAWREGDRRIINPNLKGRTVNGAISSSQIDYDRSLEGQRGFQDWTAKWATEVYRVLKPGAYLVVCGAPRSHHRMMCGLEDAGFVVRDCFAWLFGSGFPKNKNLGNGRGTALKPAHEPIALAWKPFKGSITANVEQWGTGALNIDACRIGFTSDGDKESWKWRGADKPNGGNSWKNKSAIIEQREADGRWPANVLLDEAAASALDEMTGEMVDGVAVNRNRTERAESPTGYGSKRVIPVDVGFGGSGGASRFYYVAKPSREERDYGCGRNGHPTVKPVELMRWLVKFVTPIGGTVLDPFTGSGTTGMACRYELREFIGIEKEADYLAIAERRIAAVAPLFGVSEDKTGRVPGGLTR